MIRYALICEQGHTFESWFSDSAAYDRQAKRKLVNCPHCGSAKVEKAIMAPRLASAKKRKPAVEADAVDASVAAPAAVATTSPIAVISPQEQALRAKLKELREHITKNADDVGAKFPEEARRMHYGEVDHRSIYGVASPQEAAELSEEGIEFHPLPVLPDDRN